MKVDVSSKNINKNITLGIIYKPISMLLSYIYVPVVLAYLGEVKYGVWATLLSVLSWISLFDIGIGNGLRNKLSAEFAKDHPSDSKIRRYISSAYIMLASVVLGLAAIMFIVCHVIEWNNFFGVSEFDENLRLIVIVSGACMCISFVLSICKSIYQAMQKNHVVNLMGIFQQGLMLLSVLVLATISDEKLLWVAILYGFSHIVVEIIFMAHLFRKDISLRPSIKYFSKNEAKETTNLGLLFFIVQIAAMILYSTDNIIITRVIGPAEVTSYTTANKLFSMITAVFSIIVAPFWSAMSAYKAQRDKKSVLSSTKKMLVLWGLASIGCITLVFVFKPVVKLWLGRELHFQEGLVELMCIYAIIYMWNAIYSQIGNGFELMKISVFIAILQGVINIPLSLIFAKSFDMGSVGVLLGTIISMLASAIIMPIYIRKAIRTL